MQKTKTMTRRAAQDNKKNTQNGHQQVNLPLSIAKDTAHFTRIIIQGSSEAV